MEAKKKKPRLQSDDNKATNIIACGGPNIIWYVLRYGNKLGPKKYSKAAKIYDKEFKWALKQLFGNK